MPTLWVVLANELARSPGCISIVASSASFVTPRHLSYVGIVSCSVNSLLDKEEGSLVREQYIRMRRRMPLRELEQHTIYGEQLLLDED